MAKLVSEGVRLPDNLDAYPDQNFPSSLLLPFMVKWQLHAKAVDQFDAFVAAAKAAGVGIVPIPGAASAYRPYAQQKQLFESRYVKGPGPNSKTWNGQVYHLRAGMATAAAPGGSMHGWGLAVDFMRDNGKAITLPERQKLRAIGAPFQIVDTVKSENWHFACQNADAVVGYQPAEQFPQPTEEPAPTSGQFRDLHKGDEGMDVALAQNKLRDGAGQASVGKSDGKFGAQTEAAVKAVQAFVKLPVTGVIDQVTWSVLLSLPG